MDQLHIRPGVDLTSDLPEAVIDEIRQALFEYKVIFFRDQPLTPARHVASCDQSSASMNSAQRR